MADIQPQPAFAVSFGVTTSGETQPFDLAGQNSPGGAARVVTALCYASAVSGSVQLTLQAYSGPDISFPAAWTSVVTLPSQSSAGTQQATATVPATANSKFRLSWAVTGAATITAVAVAVG